MPSFCRHNRFIQNCPICAPPPTPGAFGKRPAATKPAHHGRSSATRSAVRVRHAARAADDGVRSRLAPGLRGTEDIRHFSTELAFSAERLEELALAPPGLYEDIAVLDDVEEALWLAMLVVYLDPLEDDDAFANIRAAHTSWISGELPDLSTAELGPRHTHDPARGDATLVAYRHWAERAGSQAAAFAGEASWSPTRRFERLSEKMAFPGFARAARVELLAVLAALGRIDAIAAELRLGSAPNEPVVIAAKRCFGIGDAMVMEKRAADLCRACSVPLEALDLALWNWSRTGDEPRSTAGSHIEEPDAEAVERISEALGL